MINPFSKLQTAALIALLSASLAAGLFGAGFYMGKQKQEVKQERKQASEFMKYAYKAAAIADEFTRLGRELSKNVAEINAKTKQTIRTNTEYVYLNPPPASCALPADRIELRNLQIDQIWRAARKQLPSERDGGATDP